MRIWSISFSSVCLYVENRLLWVSKTLNSRNIKNSFEFITVDSCRFIVMNENKKRVLWRCSMMSTKTRKCPARIIMTKGNPPKFIMGQCRHEHMELTRGNYKSQVGSINLDQVKPDFFVCDAYE